MSLTQKWTSPAEKWPSRPPAEWVLLHFHSQKGHQAFSAIFLHLVDARKSLDCLAAVPAPQKRANRKSVNPPNSESRLKDFHTGHLEINIATKKVKTCENHLVSHYFTISERTKGMKSFVLASNVTQWPLVWQWHMLSLLSKKSKVLKFSKLHKVAFKHHWGQGD